jgi:hypothetical protein
MWRRINEPIDASTQDRDGLPYPVLRTVVWKGRRFQLIGPGQIVADRESLYYDAQTRSLRLAVRFDRENDQWFLEGIDDGARMSN